MTMTILNDHSWFSIYLFVTSHFALVLFRASFPSLSLQLKCNLVCFLWSGDWRALFTVHVCSSVLFLMSHNQMLERLLLILKDYVVYDLHPGPNYSSDSDRRSTLYGTHSLCNRLRGMQRSLEEVEEETNTLILAFFQKYDALDGLAFECRSNALSRVSMG